MPALASFGGILGGGGWGPQRHSRSDGMANFIPPPPAPAAAFLSCTSCRSHRHTDRHALRWGSVGGLTPKNHRPRLSSKHAPKKENIPTMPPISIPTKNGGERPPPPPSSKKVFTKFPKPKD